MMKQAQQMQERLQQQMAELRVEGNAGGGMVTVVVNGAKQVQSLKIDPEVVSKDDVEMLQDLIVAAINDARQMVGTGFHNGQQRAFLRTPGAPALAAADPWHDRDPSGANGAACTRETLGRFRASARALRRGGDPRSAGEFSGGFFGDVKCPCRKTLRDPALWHHGPLLCRSP